MATSWVSGRMNVCHPDPWEMVIWTQTLPVCFVFFASIVVVPTMSLLWMFFQGKLH